MPKQLLVLLALALGALLVFSFFFPEREEVAADYRDAAYVIEGKEVKLTDGMSETEAAPGSASKIVTRYFGNEAKLDLNGDGKEDVVFLLTQEGGGSGIFYYAVAALATEEGYVGSEGYPLGDRIAPMNTHPSTKPNHKNVVVVNYADRKPGEPMTASPSVGKSVYLKLDPSSRTWGIVEPDFEGEADPSRMSLSMKRWVWERALYNDGREVRPKQAGAFSVSFGADGKFSGTTDCNSFGGTYKDEAGRLAWSDTYTTKKFCEGSEEGIFTGLLMDSVSYHFTSRGELILDLKFDSGSVVLR